MLKFALFVLLTFSVSADGFSAWRQRAWTILDEGSRHEEMEVQMLTLFGAKLSQDEGAMTFYMRALKSPKPELQLAAIKSLASLKNDRADEALQEGLRSNEVIIRLETLLLMAQKGMQGVSDHVEGLMAKIPKPLHVIFPPLFAMAGDPSSLKQLRLLLSDSDDRVRAASAMSVEKGGIEEFFASHQKACQTGQPHCARSSRSLFRCVRRFNLLAYLKKIDHLSLSRGQNYRLASLCSPQRRRGASPFD